MSRSLAPLRARRNTLAHDDRMLRESPPRERITALDRGIIRPR